MRRATATPTCAALDRRVGGDGRVRRALRPRRRGARPRRAPRREVYDDLLSGIVETFPPTSVWELPESTYADGRQCFVTFDPLPATWPPRPAWSTSSCGSPPTSTGTSTYAGTARRWSASTPTACWCSATTTRPSCAAAWSETDRPDPPAATGRRVARQPGDRPRPPAGGRLAVPALRADPGRPAAARPRLPRAPRLRPPLPAHRPETGGRRPHRHAAAGRRATARALGRVLRLAGRAAAHRFVSGLA